MSSDIVLAPEAKLVLIVLALCVIVMALIFATITLVRFEKVGKSAKEGALTEPDSVSAKPASLAQPTPLPEATFEVSDLKISPFRAKAGEVVTISAVVTNTSLYPGYYTTELKVNGKLVGMKAFPLAPKASQLATFEVIGNSAGEHKVEVGGVEGKFIIPEADITVTALDIKPQEVKEGEKVTIVVEVTNRGGITGSRKLELGLDGVVLTTKEISVPPGGTESVVFAIAESEPGVHEVEVGGLKGKFFIPEANIRITALQVNPRRVKEREKIEVTAELINTGGVTGSQKLELKLGGVVTATQEVTVAPGTSQKVSFILTKLKPGFHKVEVGRFEDRIMVEMADYFETL